MSGKSKADQPASTNPTPAPMTIQPFMPGNQQALAEQLQMGFGGNLSDYLASLSQVTRPMTIPDYANGAPLVPGSGNGGTQRKGQALFDLFQPLRDALGIDG